jgi:hypothetical protein
MPGPTSEARSPGGGILILCRGAAEVGAAEVGVYETSEMDIEPA